MGLVPYFRIWTLVGDVSIFVVEETCERVFKGLVKKDRFLVWVRVVNLPFPFAFAFPEVLVVNWGVPCEGLRISIKLEVVLAG